jgi:hypothetical protein
MVAKNDPTFRVTPHRHKLNFMRGTKVFTVNAPEIPMNHFEFMPFQEILASTKEDRYLGKIYIVLDLFIFMWYSAIICFKEKNYM